MARYEAAGRRGSAAADAAAPVGGQAARSDTMARLMELLGEAAKQDGSPLEIRQVIGRFALDAETSEEARFVDMFRYLAGEPWPEVFRCTAVEVESGEFVVWDREAGAELDRAVASSCAVPGVFPPITIAGKRYMDGGVRSGSSADLAAGHERVVLVTLMGPERPAQAGDDARMLAMRERSAREIEAVRQAGGTVEIVAPDADSVAVMGVNLMDGSLGPVAAVAGVRQGEAAAPALRDFWAG